jgi:hypothetical protein
VTEVKYVLRKEGRAGPTIKRLLIGSATQIAMDFVQVLRIREVIV